METSIRSTGNFGLDFYSRFIDNARMVDDAETKAREFLRHLIDVTPDADMKRLSLRVGKKGGYIRDYLNKESPKKLPEDVREALGAFFSLDPKSFRDGEAIPRTRTIDTEMQSNVGFFREDITPPHNMPRDVPILGTAAASNDGALQIFSEGVAYVARPPGIVGAKNIYAVYVVNDSMEPWKRPNETIYVDPYRPVSPGDYVVVQYTNGENEPTKALVKQLVRRTERAIILRQHNPAGEVTVETDKVIAIHRVLNQDELLGN